MRRVKPGDVVNIRLPYSEVCMHLKVAGRLRPVEVLPDGAQIMNWDGTNFSFPVNHGEAGIFNDGQGLYTNYLEGCKTVAGPNGDALTIISDRYEEITE